VDNLDKLSGISPARILQMALTIIGSLNVAWSKIKIEPLPQSDRSSSFQIHQVYNYLMLFNFEVTSTSSKKHFRFWGLTLEIVTCPY